MDFSPWRDEINAQLKDILDTSLPREDLAEVIRYSVFPTGKLFRPLLVYSLAQDLGEITLDHRLLACSLELHHTYTLIHDDLPAMDDDDFRRGRASSHKQFNEWKAILAGDALLNLSYEVLADIKSPDLAKLLKLYAQFMGPRGLILGQALDLSDNNNEFSEVLKVHELKTARLIQTALQGAHLLSAKKLSADDCHQLGYSLGMAFQLLDDLCELSDDISDHEKEINPFIKFDSSQVSERLLLEIKNMKNILETHKLKHLEQFIAEYLASIYKHINSHQDKISAYLDSRSQQILKNILKN